MALTEQQHPSIDQDSARHSASWVFAPEAERECSERIEHGERVGRIERVERIERAERERAAEEGERAATASLRAQVAKLERELSAIVAVGFPHIPGAAHSGPVRGHERERASTPRLLTLGELEQLRDSLAQRVYEAQRRTAGRAEFERRSRALLERMKLEPGRYRFVRLPATDVGESGCGVYRVRPRLGIIGMLAGWWELTLSSGCP
jgi:hypothetical protein